MGIRLEKTDRHMPWKNRKGIGKRLEKTPSPLKCKKILRIHPGKIGLRRERAKKFWDTPWKNRPSHGRGTIFLG
jgi:hypothetical protein